MAGWWKERSSPAPRITLCLCTSATWITVTPAHWGEACAPRRMWPWSFSASTTPAAVLPWPSGSTSILSVSMIQRPLLTEQLYSRWICGDNTAPGGYGCHHWYCIRTKGGTVVLHWKMNTAYVKFICSHCVIHLHRVRFWLCIQTKYLAGCERLVLTSLSHVPCSLQCHLPVTRGRLHDGDPPAAQELQLLHHLPSGDRHLRVQPGTDQPLSKG